MRCCICIKFAEHALRKIVDLPFMPSQGMMIDPFLRDKGDLGLTSRPLEVSSAIWNIEKREAFVVVDGTMFHTCGLEYLALTKQGWEFLP